MAAFWPNHAAPPSDPHHRLDELQEIEQDLKTRLSSLWPATYPALDWVADPLG